MDGRSDFFGPKLGGDYLAIANATAQWRQQLDNYRIDLVLVPRLSDLGARLAKDSDWQIIHSDSVSVAYRRGNPLAAQPDAPTFFPPLD